MTDKKWATWLGSLGTRLANLPPATRGLAMSHTLSYPGNVTTATLAGSVKASPDSPTELAVFTIGAAAYDAGTNKTTWAFSLAAGSGANSTGALPADSDNDGLEFFPYDLLLTLSGQPTERIAGGLLPISGYITEPA